MFTRKSGQVVLRRVRDGNGWVPLAMATRRSQLMAGLTTSMEE